MSLLAGFDLVAEIAKPAVADLLLSTVTFNGTSVNPPFELTIPLGANGNAHVIVHAATVDLVNDHDILVTLTFADSSVVGPTVLAPLAGTLAITASLVLVPPTGTNVALTADLSSASVALTLDAASQAVVEAAGIGGTGLAQLAIASYIQSQPSPSFGLSFTVVPGADGTLSPLVFERLEVHNIGSAAIGLFGVLLTAADGSGNHTQRTSTAISAGHNVAVSLSPRAFRSLIFCPAVAAHAGVAVSALPSACGGASGVSIGGATLTMIADTFVNGHIDVDGSVTRSGFCYEADATFHASISLTASGSTITPHVTIANPNVTVNIPWYCWLAAGLIAGPIGLIIVGIVSVIANSAAQSIANGAVSGALGGGLGGSSLGGFSSASFDAVTITPEGLTLEGNVSVVRPLNSAVPSVRLNGSITTQDSVEASNGVYSISSGCLQGDYPYTESLQHQTARFEAIYTLVGEPRTYTWTLSNYARLSDGIGTSTLISSAPLTGSSGTVSLDAVQCSFPVPLPAGVTVTSPVHVDYTIADNVVTLSNHDPHDGNYSLTLELNVSDPSGLQLSTSTGVGFNGDVVAIGGGYQSRFAECISSVLRTLVVQTQPNFGAILSWPTPVNYPAPEQLASMFTDLVSREGLQSDYITGHAILAHGTSVQRMLASPAVVSRLLTSADSAVPTAVPAIAARTRAVVEVNTEEKS